MTLLIDYFFSKKKQKYFKKKSGRQDSNLRPSAWKADALPTELRPLIFVILLWQGRKSFIRDKLFLLSCFFEKEKVVGGAGFEPTKS